MKIIPWKKFFNKFKVQKESEQNEFIRASIMSWLPREMTDKDHNPVDNEDEDFKDGYKTGFNQFRRELTKELNNIFKNY